MRCRKNVKRLSADEKRLFIEAILGLKAQDSVLHPGSQSRYDDFVEERAGPLDDIEMTVRHRIEAARINRASHRQKIVQESTVATLIEAPTQAIG